MKHLFLLILCTGVVSACSSSGESFVSEDEEGELLSPSGISQSEDEEEARQGEESSSDPGGEESSAEGGEEASSGESGDGQIPGEGGGESPDEEGGEFPGEEGGEESSAQGGGDETSDESGGSEAVQNVCDDLDCNDENDCTEDTCDELTGCVYEWASEGQSCDDDDACTLEDICNEGVCMGEATSCSDDDNTCTTLDGCDAQTGDCLFLAVEDGIPCDDGNFCSKGDVCVVGQCLGGEDLLCDDNDPCTDDVCDPVTGCAFFPNQAFCDDGTLCTVDDQCFEGQCEGAIAECDDGNGCTNDGCDPETGCEYVSVTGPCDDGNPCTLNDLCQNSVCVSGSKTSCDDGDVCTSDFCDASSGNCQYEYNEEPCDDGNVCLAGDSCKNGVCKGEEAIVCEDGNACTNDSCSPTQGCVYVPSICDDGIPCTIDSCDAVNGCISVVNDEACDSGEICVSDVCDLYSGCISTVQEDCCGNGLIDATAPCPFVEVSSVFECPAGCEVTPCDGENGDVFALFVSNQHELKWDETEADCQARGGHLAWIENEEENALVHSLCLEGTGVISWGCQIGLFSPYTSWTSGVPLTYTNWSADLDGSGPYTQIYLNKNGWGGQWDDVQTNGISDYICRFGPGDSGDVSGSFATASVSPLCCTGLIEGVSEECDDGNVSDGDGCSSTCETEVISAGCDAIDLDGNTDYVDLGSPAALEGPMNGDFSIGFWFYLDEFNGAFIHRGDANNDSGVNQFVNVRVTSSGNLIMHLRGSEGTGDKNAITIGSTSLDTGKWYYGMATRVLSGVTRLYVDGELDGTGTDTIGPLSKIGSSWVMGAVTYEPPFVPDKLHLNGKVTGLQIWERSLTPAEVSTLWSGSWNGVDDDLIAWFPLDEGTGGIVSDVMNFMTGVLGGNASSHWVSTPGHPQCGDEADEPGPADETVSLCANGQAFSYGGAWHVVCPGSYSKANAESVCAGMNGELVTIDSAEKNDFVWQNAQAVVGSGSQGKSWIGAEFTGGKWVWPDGYISGFTSFSTQVQPPSEYQSRGHLTITFQDTGSSQFDGWWYAPPDTSFKCHAFCQLSQEVVLGGVDYEITHTGANGDGYRWHLTPGENPGAFYLIEDVESEQVCADYCAAHTGFACTGFSYKFNGSFDGQAGLKDKDCVLLEVLSAGNTAVSDIHSCTLQNK